MTRTPLDDVHGDLTAAIIGAAQPYRCSIPARTRLILLRDDRRLLVDCRWLLVCAPQSRDVSINLELARTPDQQALGGTQGDGKPVFALGDGRLRSRLSRAEGSAVTFDGATKDAVRHRRDAQRLYGNKIYLNEDPS